MGKSRAVMGKRFGLRRHQYHHLAGLSLERTTGFEPATLTLAKKRQRLKPSEPTRTFTNSCSVTDVFE